MDATGARISPILELREILLSFQSGFNLVDAAVVCAILDSISGWNLRQLQLSPDTWNLWQWQLNLLSIYINLGDDATGVVCQQLGLLSTDLHAIGCDEGFVETLNSFCQFFFLSC